MILVDIYFNILIYLKGWQLLLKVIGREYGCPEFTVSKISEIHRSIQH